MTMEWNKLFSKKRFNGEILKESTRGRRGSIFQKDVDRIIFSRYFRVLQNKTQVHSPDVGTYVRSRLTHSIEVSSIGRELGYMLGSYLIENKKINADEYQPHDVASIMQAGCLIHDIGNPPFGHLSEAIIRSWFSEKQGRLFDDTMTAAEKQDLLEFDGNAQGLRILNNLDMYRRKGGLRLSITVLASMIKYPRPSIIQDGLESKFLHLKKAGYFQSDRELVTQICEELGLLKQNTEDELLYFHRHPLVHLLEAADDICYSIADLEDGYHLNLVTFKEFEKAVAPIASTNMELSPDSRYVEFIGDARYKTENINGKIGLLRSLAINNLVNTVFEVMIANEENVLSGKLNKDLLDLTPYGDSVRNCKDIVWQRVIKSESVKDTELLTFTVVNKILDVMSQALLDREMNKEKLLLKHKYLLDPFDMTQPQGLSRYETLMAVSDFITSLSEIEIFRLYDKIK